MTNLSWCLSHKHSIGLAHKRNASSVIVILLSAQNQGNAFHKQTTATHAVTNKTAYRIPRSLLISDALLG